jgi:hypothetical protein
MNLQTSLRQLFILILIQLTKYKAFSPPSLAGVEYLDERFAVFALEPRHTIMLLFKRIV